MPRDAMMQLLLAAFFFVFAFAELRVWNKSTFTGLESPSAAANYPDARLGRSVSLEERILPHFSFSILFLDCKTCPNITRVGVLHRPDV